MKRDLTRKFEDAGSLSGLGAQSPVGRDCLRAAVVAGQPSHVSTAWSTAKTATYVATDKVHRVLESRQAVAAGAVRGDLCGGGGESRETQGRGGGAGVSVGQDSTLMSRQAQIESITFLSEKHWFSWIHDLTREVKDAGSLSGQGAQGAVVRDRLGAAVVAGQPWHITTAWSTAKTASCIAADSIHRVFKARKIVAAGAVSGDVCGGGLKRKTEGGGAGANGGQR